MTRKVIFVDSSNYNDKLSVNILSGSTPFPSIQEGQTISIEDYKLYRVKSICWQTCSNKSKNILNMIVMIVPDTITL